MVRKEIRKKYQAARRQREDQELHILIKILTRGQNLSTYSGSQQTFTKAIFYLKLSYSESYPRCYKWRYLDYHYDPSCIP